MCVCVCASVSPAASRVVLFHVFNEVDLLCVSRSGRATREVSSPADRHRQREKENEEFRSQVSQSQIKHTKSSLKSHRTLSVKRQTKANSKEPLVFLITALEIKSSNVLFDCSVQTNIKT